MASTLPSLPLPLSDFLPCLIYFVRVCCCLLFTGLPLLGLSAAKLTHFKTQNTSSQALAPDKNIPAAFYTKAFLHRPLHPIHNPFSSHSQKSPKVEPLLFSKNWQLYFCLVYLLRASLQQNLLNSSPSISLLSPYSLLPCYLCSSSPSVAHPRSVHPDHPLRSRSFRPYNLLPCCRLQPVHRSSTFRPPGSSPSPFTPDFFTRGTFHTRHLLHQAPFTPNTFYTRHLLHQTPFTPDTFSPDTFHTKDLLHQTTFTPDNFFTKHRLHQTPFTPDNFYTGHLLHQTPCTPDKFYTRHLSRQTPFTPNTFYTRQLLH